MTKRHRRANLGVTNKEIQTMSSEPSFNGVPLTGPPNSNVIFVPENTPHSYDENGNAVFYAWPDGVGDPPAANQAPGAHANKPINTTQPQAVFGSDGTCTTAGWTPGGVYYCQGDKSEHPCSDGGPINAAKREAINNIVVWAYTLAGLSKLGGGAQPK